MNLKKISQDSPLYIIGIAGLMILCLLVGDLGRKLYWNGDYAIYLVDMFDAARFQQALGISSRFGWSHPGPLNNYLLLPFFLLSNGGDQSLVFGTTMLNCVCLFFSARLIGKMTGRSLSITFLLMLIAYVFVALGVKVVFDVLLPFSTVFPWALAVCLACAVVVRGWRHTVFLAIVLAYVTQAHVAFWIPSVILAASAVLLSVAFQRPGKRDAAYLLMAATVFFLLWLPPIIEFNNLLSIFKFFAAQPPGQHTYAEAFRALAVLVGEPLAGHRLSYTGTPSEDKAFLAGGITLLLVPILAGFGYRQKNRFVIALGAIVIFQVLGYLFSLTRVVGPIMHHSVTFIPVIAVFIFLQLGSVLYKEASKRHVLFLTSLNIAAALAVVGVFSNSLLAALDKVKTPDLVIRALSEQLLKEIRRCAGPATIRMQQDSWNMGIGAASYAYRSGATFSITPSMWSIVFSGRVPATITDCQLDFTWQDGVAGIAVNDYGNAHQYKVVPVVTLPDLTFTTFGAAEFGARTVRSPTFTDAGLVSNEIAFKRGMYRADVTFDYDVMAEASGANGAHISIHGKKMLLPILTGKNTGQHATFYLDMDGTPERISFGLGGWAKGKGAIELKQLTISSVIRIGK